jgi:endonuclease YncB( thermonuclease family)
MKKLLNSLPLLVALALLTAAYTRSQTNAPAFLLPSLFSRSVPNSEVWQIKEGSIYDGDTLRVVKGSEELKIRLCGIDAPEKKQELGIAARDYLRSLVKKGNGTVSLIPIEKDRYGRTVAELIMPVPTPEEEIFLNGEMVRAGYAWHYQQYSGNCPNKNAIALAEEMAKESKAGVWANSNSQPPWEWRKRNK